jgi:hypothetical protein
MFKNRALQVTMVRDSAGVGTPIPRKDGMTPDQINELAKDQVQNIAVSVGATILAAILTKAAADIAVHAAKKKIR